jgi:hypothetical protein
MKKSKLLVLGLIALVLAGGLVLVGCPGDSCPKVTNGNGDCYSDTANYYKCGVYRCDAAKDTGGGGRGCNC